MSHLPSGVEDPPFTPAAAIVIVSGDDLGRRIDVDHAPFTIGSDEMCSVVLRSAGVAPRHCGLEARLGHWELSTVSGRADVDVDDQSVAHATLAHRARIAVGRTILCFLRESHESLETAHFALLCDLAIRDAFTGVYTERFMNDTFAMEIAGAKADPRPVSLLLLHLDGIDSARAEPRLSDDVLDAVAKTVRDRIGAADRSSRFGDHGLAVLLGRAGNAEAMAAADRLRRAIAEATWAAVRRPKISIGVATSPAGSVPAPAMWEAAGRALRVARDAGGSTVRGTIVPL